MIIYHLRMAIILMVAISLYGCGHEAEHNKDSISFAKPTFQIPADGKLSVKQVADYILIRESVIREVNAQRSANEMTLAELKENSAAYSSFRYFDEIEKTVANSAGMSYNEYLWIKDTIISTQTKMLVQNYYDLNKRIMTLLDETLTRYKEISIEKLGQQEQLKMHGYVDEMKLEMANLRGKISDPNERSEALTYNISIVSRFNKELEKLEQQALHSFALE